MARTLASMTAKGKRKLVAKVPTMKKSYDAAKERMKTNYAAMPFGPTRVAAYKAGVDAAVYTPPDPDKWARNWKAKMAE